MVSGPDDDLADLDNPVPGRRRIRRWRRIAVWTVAVLALLLVGGTAGLGWYVSVLNLEPHHARSAPSDVALGVGGTGEAPTVVLTESRATLRPGVHALSWSGGAAMVGDVVARSPGRVERPLLRGAAPPTGTAVGVAWNYPEDPRSLLDLTIREISVPTELGPAPAWYIPGSGPAASTWVISVHGQNGTLASTMDGIPTMHRLGLSVLTISYRNDVAAPRSPDGLIHLGESEWRDVDAAIRTARGMGAQRIVLDGSSMGGSIVGQTLVHSPQAHLVDAVVLDAPGLDYELTGRAALSRVGAPEFLVAPIGLIMQWRLGFA
ncbi:MAG: alpha/beta hydrolase family protein, partial [Pseudonocardia sp.]